ncbi:DUF4185 domain-containing protein [Cryobacterium tepidiphilum]|uniref:DUF4185 domain-containing protein n=1 Tax=Cryobacterium tepidiphilum TaxID=2486026 RepID=A0A3M8LN01_9MICO|nr:DUF4185 domain-containing protein [Cryobacterium tepidiphilum]RNE66761.1 DUF4185 domain-containing protein [Cryobacterium tepidiphilum]
MIRQIDRKNKRVRGALVAVGVGAAIAVSGTAPAMATEGASSQSAPVKTCDARISASVDRELTREIGEYGDTGGRWTGADSAYSVRLPGGRIAWIYSDTFMGAVNADKSRPVTSPFLHNSIIIDDHGVLTTYTGGTPETPESLLKVAGGDENQDWYWFGDATVEGSHLRVMLLEFERTGNGVFDFAFVGSAIASFATDDMAFEGVTELPASTVNWGSAIYEDGGYTYVYGVEDLGAQKYAHLARVRAGAMTSGTWEYLSDTGWVHDASASKRILEGVSNEFSVSKFQGRYTLVTGDTTEILSAKVVMYRSSSLEGPFEDKTVLYTTPETSGNVFTYNAKAHPELGNGHTLLVTYNVNSFDTSDVYTNVDNYRPRYIDVSAVIPNCS